MVDRLTAWLVALPLGEVRVGAGLVVVEEDLGGLLRVTIRVHFHQVFLVQGGQVKSVSRGYCYVDAVIQQRSRNNATKFPKRSG